MEKQTFKEGDIVRIWGSKGFSGTYDIRSKKLTGKRGVITQSNIVEDRVIYLVEFDNDSQYYFWENEIALSGIEIDIVWEKAPSIARGRSQAHLRG